MSRPDYVPNDAENITDYGAVSNPDDDSTGDATANNQALIDAVNAAGDNGAVYVPEGEYYISDNDRSQMTQFGSREADGPSFYGDGPTKSKLAVSETRNQDSNHWLLQYDSDNGNEDHGTVTLREIEIDGNGQNISNLYAAGRSGRSLVFQAANVDKFVLKNVLFSNTYSNTITNRASAPFTAENCSWRRVGIDAVEDSDGDDGGHAISQGPPEAGKSATVKNCEFYRVASTVLNASSGGGEVTFDNCWVQSVGYAWTKLTNDVTIRLRNCFAEISTSFMNNLPDSATERHGRWLFYDVSSDGSGSATIDIRDSRFEEFERQAFNSFKGKDIMFEGDNWAVLNANQEASSGVYRENNDAQLDFNSVGTISVHDAGADVFDASNGIGSISELRRDGNSGLGDTSSISIGTDNQGSDPLSPTVPSRSDVGIQTTESTDDTSETADIDSPIPDVLHAWRLGEGSGSTVADAAGSADGEASGTDWTAGDWVGDSAMTFAADARVQIDSGRSDPGDEGTLVLTAQGDYTDSGRERGFAFAHPDHGENNRLYIKADNRNANDQWVARVGGSAQVPIGPIDPTEPIRLAVTWQDGEITTYRNGERQTTGTYASGIELDRLDWFFGAFDGSDTAQNLDGELDNVILGDTAASESQLREDFESQPWAGSDGPLFDDWTPRWASSRNDWGVDAGSEFEGGYALAFDAGSGDRARHALSCDVVGEPADVEVLDEVRVPAFPDDGSLADHARVHVRSSGDGSESGYWLGIENGEAFRLAKYTDGTETTLDRFGTPAENTFYHRRVRAEGTELRAKAWPADEAEPSGWDVAVIDEDHADGWVGLGSFDDGRVETDVVSVATGGESAQLPNADDSSDEPPSVSWRTPANGGTVSGTVTVQVAASDSEDDGGSLDVEYRIDGNAWRSASYSSDTGYYQDGWDSTTVADGSHTFEARATDSAGNTASATADVTVDNGLGVRTVGATDVTDSAATLVGELTDLGGEGEADVGFEWRETGGSWSLAGERTLSSVGEFSTELSGLAADTDYEFRAVVTAPETVDGGTVGFRTATADGGNAAPVIDQFEITDRSDSVWTRYYVDWAVSDADGDLDTVVTELRYDGATVGTESTRVSGETASYSHEMRVRGDVDAIRLTVNDAENEVASETRQL